MNMESQRDIYPIELIKTSAYAVKFLNQKKVIRRMHEPIRSLIVYLVEKHGDMWMPLNRDYKPLGLHGYDEWAKYEDYPFLLIPDDRIDLDCAPYKQKNLNSNEAYYLFDDSTFPDDAKNKKRYIQIIQNMFFKGESIIEGSLYE